MTLRKSLAKELQIQLKDIVPFSEGLSTQKFIIRNSKDPNDTFRQKFPQAEFPILIRTYSTDTHGLDFHKVANHERTALQILKSNDALVFPKLFGQIQTPHFIANVISWIDGRTPMDREMSVHAWDLLSNHCRNILPEKNQFPSHHDVIQSSLNDLKNELIYHDLVSETEFLNQFLGEFTKHPKSFDLQIVHGDFHQYNLLETKDARLAILDWEYVAIGDPLFDLIYCLFYDYGLQKESIQAFFNKRFSFIKTRGSSIEKAEFLTTTVLLLMSQWFFQRFRTTNREHNLTKAIIYLRGALDLFFR